MKQKGEKRAKVLMATAAAFIVVLAFSGIVSADPYCGGLPLTNVKEGEVSGDLWFEHYSPLTHNHAAESFTLPSYTDVEWAQLYVAVYCGHMEKNYAGRANITFNDVQLGGTDDGLSSEAFDVCYTFPGKKYTTACERGSAGYNNNASGPGTGPEWVNDHCVRVTSDYLMWYNVTDLVQPNSNVVVDTWNMEGYTGTFDNRTKVITLVVAYNDGDSDTVQYWVNQGHDVDNYYWDDQGEPNYIGETSFAADLPASSTIQKSNLTVVQMASDDGTYTYNTDSIPTDPDGTTTPPGENWQAGYSGYNIWYAASQFNSNSDNTLNYDRTGGFYKIFLGLLSAEYTEEQLPDLVPTGLEVTHNYYNGAWALLNNTVNVTVENIDSGDAGEFDVKLYAKLNDDFEEVGSETVTSLPSGNSTEASFVWTPSEAGDYSLKAVVDPDNAIAESNKTNNELIEPIDVGYNGYMGDKPLTTYAHGQIKGNISFTHGDSFYSGLVDSDGTYTVNHTVAIPDGATLKIARLYSYWTWCPDYPVMNLTFDGNTISPDQEYTDRKGWGSYYDYPTGTYGYNVTSFVTGSGSHTTVVTNTGTESFAMDGLGLLLVYTDTNGEDIEYWINEGADMLSTMDTSGGLMPEEATAQALFSGAIDLDTVSGAWLWTIVQSGGCTDNMLMFNDCDWTGVYDGTPYPDLDIDERRDVSGCLNTNDHLVQIRAADYPAGGDYLVPSNAFLVVEYKGPGEPDLIVSTIEPNCGGFLFGNESNEICAVIENNGSGNAGASNVSFVIDSFNEEVRIGGLAAGENTTVCVTDTTIRNAGDSVTITVTADCNGELNESDEQNNESIMATTVVNNGYKGKRYTGGEDITTWGTFELNGNLLYSVGDSEYVSGSDFGTTYNANWTTGDLLIPGTASIETARLFVPYTWDKDDVMPDNVSMCFNDATQTPAAHYSDRKGYDGYNYPYGMLVYDVTDNFSTGGNSATLTKSESITEVSMRGMLLVVVYEDGSEPTRKIILNEEFDMLYGGSDKCTTPEEATAYAPLGTVDMTGLTKATLITVAPGAGPAEGDLLFNGQTWTDVWNYASSSQIGISEIDVTANLSATDNEVGFQSSADYMEASNAFLVVEYDGGHNVSITADPEAQTTTPNVNATYTLTVTNNGTVTDTIELTIQANEADAALSEDTLILNASESATVSLNVKDADVGIYNTTVRATSEVDPSVYDEATVKTTVTDGEPTADNLTIPDASGSPGSYVDVNVSINNTMNGPIQGIRLEVDYNESVLNMTSISSGYLTSTWTRFRLGEDGHTMTLATENTGDAIQNGSSGIVVQMNFSVIGSYGDTSPMDLSLIELSNQEGQTGTAPAINGTFTVTPPVKGRITYACNETGIADVNMNLDADTTVTNDTGYYNFTDVSPGGYVVSATKPMFWDNSTEVTVIAGKVTTANMTLYLKGDLNNDGHVADPGDVILMLQASARDIPGDYQYDLNGNGVIADAGDVVLILRASVGDITLW